VVARAVRTMVRPTRRRATRRRATTRRRRPVRLRRIDRLLALRPRRHRRRHGVRRRAGDIHGARRDPLHRRAGRRGHGVPLARRDARRRYRRRAGARDGECRRVRDERRALVARERAAALHGGPGRRAGRGVRTRRWRGRMPVGSDRGAEHDPEFCCDGGLADCQPIETPYDCDSLAALLEGDGTTG
jgi:hypothetical protein